MLKKNRTINADPGTNAEPEAAKAPRSNVVRETADYVVTRDKVSKEIGGVVYRVHEYTVTYTAGGAPSVCGSLADVRRALRDLGFSTRRAAGPAWGTLALIRHARGLSTLAERRGPDTRAAIDGAIASINADLNWQVSMGVDVTAIRNAEDTRIQNVKTAKTK